MALLNEAGAVAPVGAQGEELGDAEKAEGEGVDGEHVRRTFAPRHSLMHACPYQSLENRELTALIDEVPKMEASALLSRRIEEGDPDSPTLRDYVLARFEMLLCLNLTKTALETLMQQDNRERGGKTLIPTTLGQFKKLTLFLHGEIRFYPVCCVACDASEHSCPVCKARLFVAENSKRPKRIMFVRSLRAFVTDLLRVPDLAEAVRSMQKRVQRTGVIADVWDGEIVKELVAGGAHKPILRSLDSLTRPQAFFGQARIWSSWGAGTGSAPSRTCRASPWTSRHSPCSTCHRHCASAPS